MQSGVWLKQHSAQQHGRWLRYWKFSFPCGLRGYHEYRTIWIPELNEVLSAKHERSNPHDRYAIAAFKRRPEFLREQIVGHLPREISRFIVHGGVVTVKVLDVNHRRSPLIQGGLEIPVEVSVVMEHNEENKLALGIYESLVKEHYKEPIDGEFDDATASILEGIASGTESDTDVEEED